MLKFWLAPFSGPEDAGSGGGTTDNAAASVTGGAPEPSTSGNVSSGTASDAMVKAAMAASSADGSPAGNEAETAAITAGIAGTVAKPVVDPNQPAKGAQAATKGEAPESRIQAAVRNARAEVETQYAWAKDLNPTHVSVAMDVATEISRDAKGFASRLAGELGMKLVPIKEQAQPPQGGQATGDGQAELPKPRLRAEDGTAAYAADQMPAIIDAITKRITAQFEGRIKPLVDDRERNQRTALATEQRESARQTVEGALAKARQLPHFTKENEPHILGLLKAIPQAERLQMGPIGAMYHAYNQFLAQKVFPSVDTAAEERVRASYAKKAATSVGSGHPVDQGGNGKSTEIKGVDGLARHMERLAQQAAAG